MAVALDARRPSLNLTLPDWLARALPRLGVLAFLLGIAYLVLMPLYRLQQLAFENDAAGYSAAFDRADIADTIKATIGLALGSLVIALVLGTILAWAATRLPPGMKLLRVLPI
ncbi:MAG TPA: hypothetical protein VFK43_21895, partial [Acidimicrobiales bacterium]|nr:hypothetical protein [Acidimicrobiales bacterium]